MTFNLRLHSQHFTGVADREIITANRREETCTCSGTEEREQTVGCPGRSKDWLKSSAQPSTRGEEADKNEVQDPLRTSEDPDWAMGYWVGWPFFGSSLDYLASIGVAQIMAIFGKFTLLPCCPRHFHAWKGSDRQGVLHAWGMPTKAIPSTEQDWEEVDQFQEYLHHWIALRRSKVRTSWSLSSPVSCELPPGAVVRVIGETKLVNKKVVRALAEFTAPWRRPGFPDMGFITLRVLDPEGPVVFRLINSGEQVFARDVVPNTLYHYSSKEIKWHWEMDSSCSYNGDDVGDDVPPNSADTWTWQDADQIDKSKPDKSVASSLSSSSSSALFHIERKEPGRASDNILFGCPGATQNLYGLEFQTEECIASPLDLLLSVASMAKAPPRRLGVQHQAGGDG
eukprot:6110544-Amphidinium_carterae.1